MESKEKLIEKSPQTSSNSDISQVFCLFLFFFNALLDFLFLFWKKKKNDLTPSLI